MPGEPFALEQYEYMFAKIINMVALLTEAHVQ